MLQPLARSVSQAPSHSCWRLGFPLSLYYIGLEPMTLCVHSLWLELESTAFTLCAAVGKEATVFLGVFGDFVEVIRQNTLHVDQWDTHSDFSS